MKNDVNRLILTGRVTRDTTLRQTPGGTNVADNSLAVNRSYGQKEETGFYELTFWAKSAETAAQYLTKGKPILVEGRLQHEKWTKDGQNHQKVSVVVENFQFLPDGKKPEEASAPELSTETQAEGELKF